MNKTVKAIAAGLCVLLLCGCAVSPVINSEPEQEKIQIIGQIDGKTDAAEAHLVTPTPGADQENVSGAGASSPSKPASLETSVPTETPVETSVPTETPAETPAPTETPEPTGTPTPNRTKAEQLCDTARALLDVPYLKGGKTAEGFDPGGFTYYCLNAVGVKVRHKTSKGYSEMEDWQKVASMDDLVPGDLCFFMTSGKDAVNCVCVYLGDGKMIYPSSSQGKVIITSISSDYWTEAFVFARRVF